MSDDPDLLPIERATVAADKAEAAAVRRRWINLGEIVGICGLVISGLALWNGYSDHRADVAQRQIEKADESKARTLVLFTATPNHGGDRLDLKDAAHPVQGIDVRFPSALGIGQQTAMIEPRIEARWFADAILKATDKGPDAREGRLPVLVTAHYWDADQQRHDSALYDVVWKTEGRFLRGRRLMLEGVMLRERTGSAARLDAAWVREKPGN